MKILHISDLHFRSKDAASQSIIVEKLIKNLIDKETKIDFFLFTGDVVFSGENYSDFEQAYEQFFKKIGTALALPKKNLIVCPGNHDVDRKKVSLPIKDFIRKFKTNEEINLFSDQRKDDEFGISCKTLDNYRQFEKYLYKVSEQEQISELTELFTIHYREVDGQKVAFVSINTAWCSTGNDDSGNLFFPKSQLERIIFRLNEKGIKWRVLLLHHPLNYFREFNKIEIEEFIYSEFHFMFSGHLHKREDFIKLMHNEGIFGTQAHASFTTKEDGKIGYTILDIDLETLDIHLKKHVYDFEERVFLPFEPIRTTFPFNDEKHEQIRILKTLRKRHIEVTEKANENSVHQNEKESNKGFNEMFVEPVLKSQPQVEAETSFSPSSRVKMSELYKHQNYLLYGKDKIGKTSLLLKVKIDLLSNFSQLGVIPIYINLSEFKENPRKFDLKRIISKFLEQTLAATERLLGVYKFKVLIDNFDPSITEVKDHLSLFFNTFSGSAYVITADQTLSQSYETIDYGFDGYQKLFIHDISRNEIRQLTKKWPSIPENKRDEFVDRIVDVLKQHGMPFNFWTISVFLWIFSGKNTLNFNNNSELLELYIDDILDRNKLANDPQNRFSYTNYKSLLSSLAFFLLTKQSQFNYSIKYFDLTNFVERFKNENPRRVGKTSEIVGHLLERGILKMTEDDFVTFRLNGVFEYFIAFSFIENKQYVQEIITTPSLYLSFKNELEIYSGFQRSESESKQFLQTVFDKTKEVFDELNQRMQGDLDLRLQKKIGDNGLDFTKPLTELATSSELMPLSDGEKDEFLDEVASGIAREVEVVPKKIYDVSVKRFDILERHLLISGRIFKNIDNISDAEFVEAVFDYIIDSSCNLGFLLIEEIEENIDPKYLDDIEYKNPKKFIFQMITNYLPSVVQSFVFDSIGHINLEGIINKKIDTLKKNSSINQYKLFIYYCLLLDLDLKKYKSKIGEMIGLARMGIIKSSFLIKLIYLLLFKCYDDDNLIAFMKEKLRELNISLNPKANMKEFDKNFEKTKKMLQLKRSASKRD